MLQNKRLRDIALNIHKKHELYINPATKITTKP